MRFSAEGKRLNRSLLALILIARLLFLAIFSVSSDAQDYRFVASSGEGSLSPEPVLVLITGQVVAGRITPRPDGYDVVLKAGRLFVPSERVRFQAADLQDAYKKLRSSLPQLTPNHHVELAKWCESNLLYEEARRELLDALQMDPNRLEAKRMLLSILQKQQRDPDTGSAGLGLTEYPSRSEFIGSTIASRSLGGLTRVNAKEFVVHVQPLIVNKCAGGGCHTATDSGFAVFSTRQGATPLISERNLASVLRHVDLSTPAASRFLVAPMESHGGEATPVFRGRAGSAQMQVLKNWVFSVAAELRTDELGSDSVSETAGASLAAKQSVVLAGNEVADVVSSAGLLSPHGRELSLAEMDSTLLAEVKRMDRRDAFDPNEFNQKYHRPLEMNNKRGTTTSGNQK